LRILAKYHRVARDIVEALLTIEVTAEIAEVPGIARNGAELFAVAAENLWVKRVFATAAIAERLHDWVDLLFEDFGELRKEFQ